MRMNSAGSNENDPVRPSEKQVVQTVKKSQDTWFNDVPATLNLEEFPKPCFEFSKMLERAPEMPDDSSIDSWRRPLRKAVDGGHLLVYGYSTWEITGTRECGLGGNLKTTDCCPVVLGVKRATSLATNDTVTRPSNEYKFQPSSVTIAAIFLGLTYIFSQRLIELQGHGIGDELSAGYIRYTDNLAPEFEERRGSCSPFTDVSIGNADGEAKRWWQAILAPDKGWEAMIATSATRSFFAPWAIRNGKTLAFRIQHEGCSEISSNIPPPSSTRALGFLQAFCKLHQAETEFPVAIAMTLLLPAHNYYNFPVNLAFTLLHRVCERNVENPFDDKQMEKLQENLSKYTTIACNPRGIISNLCGVFWEPDIPCNLASAWLYPPSDQLPHIPGIDGLQHRYYEVLVRGCAIRRPSLAPLFLAASITNLMSVVLRFAKTGLPPLDLDAAAWMSSEQSFIQHPETKPSKLSAGMSRPDVWRLLYITGEYGTPPLTPWKPFGDMAIQDIPLSARIHRECSEHLLRFHHWSWELVDGSVLEDKVGQREACVDESSSQTAHSTMLSLADPSELIPPSDTASEVATKHAFQWVAANGDGYAPGEHNIYSHDWIMIKDESCEESLPSDEELSDCDSKARHSSFRSVEGWLMQ